MTADAHLQAGSWRRTPAHDAVRDIAEQAAQRMDLHRFRHVAAAGEGQGDLLAAFLTAWPDLNGTWVGPAHAADDAARSLAQRGLGARTRFVAERFFETLPEADLILLNGALHQRADDEAAFILAACRRALPRHGRLLVLERLPPGASTSGVVDASYAGAATARARQAGRRERTETDFVLMLQDQDLRLAGTWPLSFEFSLLACAPALDSLTTLTAATDRTAIWSPN